MDVLGVTRAEVVTAEVAEQLRDIFQPHSTDASQNAAMAMVRSALESAAAVIINNVPPCASRTTALRKLHEARMDSVFAIASEGAF